MAQNITLMGASYSDVPAVTLPKTGGGTASFTDVTDTTAQASDVASGKYFYTSAGERTQGTSSGGGGSGITLVAQKTVTASTTSTSAATVETWSTGKSELWTSGKFIYVQIRDTAGKREGYFYGSDQFLILTPNALNSTSSTFFVRDCWYYYSSAYGGVSGTGSTGYGVYADQLYPDGRIRIRKRYSSSSSRTVNGTYSIKVYLIEPSTLFG